jgi:hypothetical protein
MRWLLTNKSRQKINFKKFTVKHVNIHTNLIGSYGAVNKYLLCKT